MNVPNFGKVSSDFAHFMSDNPEVAVAFLAAVGETNMIPLSGAHEPDPIVNVFANRIAQGLATSHASNEIIKFAKMVAAQYRMWQRHQQQPQAASTIPILDRLNLQI